MDFSESHVAHLVDKSEDEINRLISLVVDVDNMYIKMKNEENALTKTVFNYLFRVSNLSKAIVKVFYNISCKICFTFSFSI